MNGNIINVFFFLFMMISEYWIIKYKWINCKEKIIEM